MGKQARTVFKSRARMIIRCSGCRGGSVNTVEDFSEERRKAKRSNNRSGRCTGGGVTLAERPLAKARKVIARRGWGVSDIPWAMRSR